MNPSFNFRDLGFLGSIQSNNHASHHQLTNSLIDPNIDLPLITEDKVEEVFTNFKRYNSLTIPLHNKNDRNNNQNSNNSTDFTRNYKTVPKVIKLASLPNKKIIRLSLSRDSTQRERENYLNIRKANQEKVLRRDFISLESVPSNSSLDFTGEDPNMTKPVKSNRSLLKCPYHSCGLRYQLNPLIRHLLVYHGESIEMIPKMLELTQDEIKGFLNSNISESNARINNLNMRKSFAFINSSSSNNNNVSSVQKASPEQPAFQHTAPQKDSIKFAQNNNNSLFSGQGAMKGLVESKPYASNKTSFIDDSAIGNRPKFHVIAVPRRSLVSKTVSECNGQNQSRNPTFSVRQVKRDQNPISTSLSSLTLTNNPSTAPARGDQPTPSYPSSQRHSLKMSDIRKSNPLLSIRLSSPDDYIPVGKTTFHSTTNLVSQKAQNRSDDFVYPEVGLLITSSSASNQSDSFTCHTSENTLVNSNPTVKSLKTFAHKLNCDQAIDGTVDNFSPLSHPRSNEEVLTRRRSLSANTSEEINEICSYQTYNNAASQSNEPLAVHQGENEAHCYHQSSTLLRDYEDVPRGRAFSPNTRSQSMIFNSQNELPPRRPYSNDYTKNRVDYFDSKLAGHQFQPRQKAMPNVRLVYECPIRDCTAVFPSEPAFQRHFDSVHDKVSSGGLIIAQPNFYNNLHPNKTRSYYHQDAENKEGFELSFINSLDLFMPSGQDRPGDMCPKTPAFLQSNLLSETQGQTLMEHYSNEHTDNKNSSTPTNTNMEENPIQQYPSNRSLESTYNTASWSDNFQSQDMKSPFQAAYNSGSFDEPNYAQFKTRLSMNENHSRISLKSSRCSYRKRNASESPPINQMDRYNTNNHYSKTLRNPNDVPQQVYSHDPTESIYEKYQMNKSDAIFDCKATLSQAGHSDCPTHCSSVDDGYIDVDTIPYSFNDFKSTHSATNTVDEFQFPNHRLNSNVEDNDMDLLNKIIDEYSLFQNQTTRTNRAPKEVRIDSSKRRVASPLLSVVDFINDAPVNMGANYADSQLALSTNELPRSSHRHYECPDTWQFPMTNESMQDASESLADAMHNNPAYSPSLQNIGSPYVGGLLSSLSTIAVSSNECIRTSYRANQLLADTIRRRREVLKERQLGNVQDPMQEDCCETNNLAEDNWSNYSNNNFEPAQANYYHQKGAKESSQHSVHSMFGGNESSSYYMNHYQSSNCSSTFSRQKRRHSQLSKNTSFIAEDSAFSEQSFPMHPTSLDLVSSSDHNNYSNSLSTPSSPNNRSNCKRRSLSNITECDYWSKAISRTQSIGPSCTIDMII